MLSWPLAILSVLFVHCSLLLHHSCKLFACVCTTLMYIYLCVPTRLLLQNTVIVHNCEKMPARMRARNLVQFSQLFIFMWRHWAVLLFQNLFPPLSVPHIPIIAGLLWLLFLSEYVSATCGTLHSCRNMFPPISVPNIPGVTGLLLFHNPFPTLTVPHIPDALGC